MRNLMIVLLSISTLTTSCGSADTLDEGEQAEPTDDTVEEALGDSGADKGAEEQLGAAGEELSSIGEFAWYQGWAATPMGPTSDRVCFLTMMTGKFRGGGEVVHAFHSGGMWYLSGNSFQVGVGANARCVYTPPSSYTGEYYWQQGQSYSTYMGSANGRVCFLTRVTGKFEGGGEWVHAHVSGGSWYLSGGSMQQGVAARARCMTINSYSTEHSWSQGQYATYMGGGAVNRTCALTRVTGKFMGGGEKVQAFVSGDSWYLGGSSFQAGVAASARCF